MNNIEKCGYTFLHIIWPSSGYSNINLKVTIAPIIKGLIDMHCTTINLRSQM
jgi:hypothetical protein